MTIQESKKIGGKQILIASLFMFVIYDLSILYSQTKGDFGNGILFFISIQTNGFFLLFITLSFVCMYFSGRQAGFLILYKKWRDMPVVLIFSLLTSFFISGLFYLVAYLTLYREVLTPTVKEIVVGFGKIFIPLFFLMTLAWYFVVWRIRAKIKI